MFLVSTFAAARGEHNSISFGTSSAKLCQLGNNINKSPAF